MLLQCVLVLMTVLQFGGDMYSSKRFGYVARRTGAVVLLAILLASPGPASAQAPGSRPAAIPPDSQLFLSWIYNGVALDRYLEALRMGFLQLDADADGRITQRDVDLHTLMESVERRTFVMRFDLDGDGAVTEEEVRRTMKYDTRVQSGLDAVNAAGRSPAVVSPGQAQIDYTVKLVMALDTDKDGKVSSAEAAKYAMPGWQVSEQNAHSARARQALASELATTGEITLVNYQTAGEALFRKIDSDNDGKISQQEMEELARKKREAEQRAGCEMPAPSPKARVILLSSYQTEALSSVAIGSQDAVVHAGRIHVEPGDEPLYVVISTYAAMVWQFSGAVDRVEWLAMSSFITGPNSGDERQPSLVGVTGLSPDKVLFFARSGCFGYFFEMPSSDSIQSVATVREATGREPFKVSTAYSVLSFSIPSGKVETLANPHPKLVIVEEKPGMFHVEGNPADFIVRAGPSRARDDLYDYSPGGLVEIDPKSVVASVPVQTYEVFPQQAGLVQLLESGALKQNRSGEYIVQKKTRFPAGLAGGHAVRFVVLRGVPVPDGDPGHSCVTVEDQTSARKFEPCR